MLRLSKIYCYIGLVLAYLFISSGISAFAHSGHKHEEKLRVSLPNVVAKVNGEDIHSEGIARELKQTLTKYKDRGMPLSAEEEKIATKKLIDNEIGRALLLQNGKRIGANLTDEMFTRKLGQIKSSFKSDAVFEHELKNRKMTMEQYKRELRTDLLMQQVIDQEITPKIKIKQDEVKSFYEKNKEKYRTDKKARASVILIKAKRDDKESQESAKKKIKNALQEIKSGTSFSDVAAKYSEDSLKSKGGDLGYFKKNQIFGAFSSRAFDMKIGEVSPIFKTGHGLHILKLTDLKEGDILSLDKVKAEIEKRLKKNKVGSATRNYIKALKQKADIKIYF